MSNRIVKFRIWDNLKKEWLSNKSICRFKTDDTGEATIEPPAFYWKQHSEGMTFCQFTGAVDKNGKDIYEGDIVEEKVQRDNYYVSYVSEVVWRGYAWHLLHRNEYSPFHLEDFNNYEVIGNIYENPQPNYDR